MRNDDQPIGTVEEVHEDGTVTIRMSMSQLPRLLRHLAGGKATVRGVHPINEGVALEMLLDRSSVEPVPNPPDADDGT